jgi:hypothetical protein
LAYSDHTPSEPDYYEEHKGDTQYHDNENHKDGPEGCKYEHGELKYKGEGVHEPEELEYEGDEVHEQEEFEYEGNEVCQQEEMEYECRELEYHNTGMDNRIYEPQGPRYDSDEACEQEELTRMADKWGYKPHGLEYNGSTLGTNDDKYGHNDNDDDDVYTSTPMYIPTSPFFTLAPIPCPHNLPNAIQQGHVTTLNDAQAAREHACADHSNTISYSPDHSDPTLNLPLLPKPSTFLKTLHHGADNGSLSTAAYIDQLQNYMEQCVYDQDEWEVNVQVEMRNNHNISYPKHDYLATPRSWDTANEPGHGLPHTIESSRPLGTALKRCHY